MTYIYILSLDDLWVCGWLKVISSQEVCYAYEDMRTDISIYVVEELPKQLLASYLILASN